MVPDARPLLGSQQVLGDGGEELPGLLGVPRGGVGRVDDCLDPGQGGVQTRPGSHVCPR